MRRTVQKTLALLLCLVLLLGLMPAVHVHRRAVTPGSAAGS